MNDYELRKFVAPEFVFGYGAAGLAGRHARNLGASRCLVVSDHGVAAAGHTETVLATLREEGIACATFLGVSENPRDTEVMQGSELFRAEGCDAIVAVGGGSPMDCAKGIGIMVANGGHILDYEGVDAIPKPMPPLVCVPTTAGSSADVSQFAIIRDTPRKVKIAIVSKANVPDVALVDPLTTLTKPRDLTAATGLDALTHAVEAYASNAHSPVTDMFALEAIRGIGTALFDVLDNLHDRDARARMALGSMNAGLAFSNAILGAVHALSHSLGGMLDLPHGECNALLLPFVARRNFTAAPQRYRKVAEALGVADALSAPDDEVRDALFARLSDMRRRAGFDKGLAQYGVTREQLAELARMALEDPCLSTNPAPLGARELEELYAEAF